MTARHFCAAAGIAIAVGTVVFMQSLVATNDRQSTAVAERLLRSVPVDPQSKIARMTLDYRPGGRVMQGPPMVAMVSAGELPEKLRGARLAAGECAVTRALFGQRRLDAPPLGAELTFVGSAGAYRLKIAAILDWDRPLRGYPNVFVPEIPEAMSAEQWQPWQPRSANDLSPGFKSDAGRNFDRAKGLLLWGAALTALCLLVNSLLLSVEARRKDLAILRMLGMTRGRVAMSVAGESLLLASAGAAAGFAGAVAGLLVYVACDRETFPLGAAVHWRQSAVCIASALAVSVLAALIALKPALSVKPLEAASARQARPRRLGTFLSFACGFGAFVAVEVWGASLMSAFVPSKEWPDAIVSILPGGASSFDLEKLRRGRIAGVRRIHELLPLQVNLDPLEELRGFGAGEGSACRGVRAKEYRNALLLGSDWLPDFKFVQGRRETAAEAMAAGDACIITEMMARAHRLKLGDKLRLDAAGRGLKLQLAIAGVVDLNWHMVTSRGLVRGLNRMPVNTDGPVFVSFDTVEACDLRPAAMVRMTHLWLDYEPEFLRRHGVFEAGRIVEREIAAILSAASGQSDDGGNAVRLHARDEIADGTLAHGADLIGSMARVPFIFVAVVSLGLIALIMASVESRKRTFAVLRAVGATTGQLAWMVARDALKPAGWGIAAGCAGGALVGWLCTGATRAAMSNWGLPSSFAVPVGTIASGAAAAVAIALTVAVPASLAIVRRNLRRR